MKWPCIIFLILGGSGLTRISAERDPFWPIGYTPGKPQPAATPEPPGPTPEPVRTLSDEELRMLAREEANRIRQSIQRNAKATVIMGNRIMTLIKGELLEEGDSFEVEAYGKRYRLEITRLTTDNIELRPHRVVEPQP